MALSWGAWEYSGGNGMRVGLDVTWSAVTTSSTSVTATIKVYTENQFSFSDGQTLTYDNDISGTTGFTNDDGGSAQLRATKTFTHNYSTYGSSPGTATFKATISGAYNGVTPSKSVTTTIPARPYAASNDPSAFTVTRNSDSQATLNWTGNNTSQRPNTSQTIQMRTFTGSTYGSYATVATTNDTSGAASYVKTGLTVNHKYQFQVRNNNSVGSSSYVSATEIYMTPAAPSGITAGVNPAGTQIIINWTNNHYVDSGNVLHIERSVNGAAYADLAGATALATATVTFTDTSPGAGTNKYRIRAKRTSPTALNSATVESNTVNTIVAPLAPTALDPTGVTVDLVAGDLVLSWTHNHGGDGAAQSRYTIEVSTTGGAPFSTLTGANDIASAVSSHTITAGTLANGSTYTWRVKTTGATSAGYGPVSATANFTGALSPVLAITTPADFGTTTTLPLSAIWTFNQTQTRWEATLYDTDAVTVLEELSADNASLAEAFTFPVEDGHTYVIKIRGRASSGLFSAYDTATTTIDLPPPAGVQTEATYQPCTGTVLFDITGNTPGGGEDPIEYISIQRRDPDTGNWFTFATNIDLPASLVDAIPQTVGINTYRIITHADTGATTVGPNIEVCGTNHLNENLWAFLSYGDGFANVLRVRGDLSIGSRVVRNRAGQHFLGSGLPAALIGGSKDRVVSLSGSLHWDINEDLLCPPTEDNLVDTELEAKANYSLNPSFETNTTSWANYTNATLAQSAAQALVGTQSLRLTSIAAGTMGAMTNPNTTVAPGETWTVSGWFRAATVARQVTIALEWKTAGGAFISVTNGVPVINDTTTGWVRVDATGIAPDTAGLMQTDFVVLGAAGAGEQHYLDAVLIEKSPTVNAYYDGASDDDGLYTYDWFGAANASVSVATPAPNKVYRRNLLKNPSLEPSAGLGAMYSNDGGLYGSAQDTAIFHTGTRSTKFTALTGGVSQILSGYYQEGSLTSVAVNPGTTYSATAYVRTAIPDCVARVGAYFFNTDPALTSSVVPATIPIPVNVWVPVTVTATADALAAGVLLDVLVAKATGLASMGDVAWVDSLIMVEGDSPPDYFDGDGEDAAAVYEWVGTPHNSFSVQYQTIEGPCYVETDCIFDSPRDDWEDASWDSEVVCYRDYTGRRMFGILSEVSTSEILHPGVCDVAFAVTETRFNERTGEL